MTIKKVLSAACVFIALGALSASAADTQQPTTKRSASKNKARYFNPFDVQQRTRLKMNRFGFFTLVPVSSAASPVSVVSQPTADVQASNNLSPSTVSQTSTATSTTTPAATTANTESVASTQLISAMTTAISPTTAVGAGSTLIASSSFYVPPSTAADMPMSIRPPFRPPVRSPFRPPVRPPF